MKKITALLIVGAVISMYIVLYALSWNHANDKWTVKEKTEWHGETSDKYWMVYNAGPNLTVDEYTWENTDIGYLDEEERNEEMTLYVLISSMPLFVLAIVLGNI